MPADVIGMQDFRGIATTPFVECDLNPLMVAPFMWRPQLDYTPDETHVCLFFTNDARTFGDFSHDRPLSQARDRCSSVRCVQLESVDLIP